MAFDRGRPARVEVADTAIAETEEASNGHTCCSIQADRISPTHRPERGRRQMTTDRTTRRTRSLRLLAAGAALLLVAILVPSTSAAPAYTGWSAPVNLGATINSASREVSPAISPDGLSLYYYSDRPGGFGADDIYASRRAMLGAAWGPPVNLGATINSASREFAMSFSPDGHWLYFTSDRPGGVGGSDAYQSFRVNVNDDFGWQAPTNLGPPVNTTAFDGAISYFENGGQPQLFFGSGRPGGLGGIDIWVTTRQADGSWGLPTAMPELSSPTAENRPNIRADGLEIFLYSDRPGGVGGNDLWVSTRPTVDSPWSTPVSLPAPVNATASEQHPSLSTDGRTLFFASDRASGSGASDLWMTTRAAKLTVTANDQGRLFGQASPPLAYELSGFVGGETSAVVSGSASCSTTATPSSPAGDYPITCTEGSLSAPGYVFETFVAGTLTVSYSQPCLTGPSAGPLRVAAGEAVCIGAGAAHAGPVTVAAGGSLDVEGGRITGPLTANGAAAVRICGATITGPLTITGSTGPVVVGGDGCDPNTVVGPVRLTDNAGGVEVSGNTVVGPLRVTGNAAPVDADGNTVTGPVTIQT
jgi:hypothetical protein